MDLTVVVGIIVGVLVVWLVLLVLFFVLRPKGVPAREIIGIVPDALRLIRSLVTDRTVPVDVRLVLILLLVWIISPIDLIPEFIPVLGPLDDVIVAVASMRFVRRRLGMDELRRRWVGTPDGFVLLARVIGSN